MTSRGPEAKFGGTVCRKQSELSLRKSRAMSRTFTLIIEWSYVQGFESPGARTPDGAGLRDGGRRAGKDIDAIGSTWLGKV